VLVGDVYLFLKSDLLIMQLAKTVLEHLSLDLFLLKLQSLLKLAGSIQSSSFVHVLR